MSTPTNYAKMTVAQLKEELVQKGLDTSGKKAELIERLTSVGKIAPHLYQLFTVGHALGIGPLNLF